MRTDTLQDYKRRMLRVLTHIQANLDDALDLEQLAGLACFSPYHFHRIFKGMVGESLKAYIRRLRLERAASQLKAGFAPIIRIALDAGYESHEAFTRSFRLAFGVSPSRYRSSSRAPIVPAAPSGLHYSDGRVVTNFKTLNRGVSKMKVEIKQIKPIRVAFIRHVGPYSEVGAAWERLLPLLGKEGFLGGNAMILGVCYDDPESTPPDKIRYDACVSVDESFVPSGEIGVQIVAGGDYAVTTHCGPYNKLGETYAKLFGQWLPRSGRQMRSAPCFEVYLSDPQSTPPEELLTDIYAPV